jgi:inosine-uridine nucleoside N-ribohydrolase
MFSSRSGVGNVTKAAEFNFYADPEAAHIVFDSINQDIVLLPWETCLEKNVQFTLVKPFILLNKQIQI